jgi:hypothetical protein
MQLKSIASVLLLLAAMSAQNAPSTNKGRHLDISAIAREANGSVVSIVMSDKKGHPIAQGSGFLISKDGRIVTNYHVIKSGSSAVIKLPDGASFPVEGVLVSDKHRDVAIIKAHGSDFRALTLGDSDRLQVGEEVVAIGSPLSLESTVSNGIVSGIRTVEEEGGKFLQITAPISPGSSGGPLFNMSGKVVGITTAGLRGGENLNFAIPINDLKSLTLVPGSAVPLAFPDEAEDDKPTAVASTQKGPNLKETIDPSLKDTVTFMGTMVAPDGRTLTADKCSVSLMNTIIQRGVAIDGKTIVGGDHYEYTYSIVEDPQIAADFNLSDMDPSSTKLFNVFSPETLSRYRQAHSAVGDYASLPTKDRAVVMLSTRDHQSKIVLGLLNKKGDDVERGTGGVLVIVFGSPDRAARFVTAFNHAVTLCGGRPSDFPPAATSK